MSRNGFGQYIKYCVYSPSSHSDDDLVALARERGPSADDALHALLRRYEGDVYRACISCLRDVGLAEEASQEALIRVYRALNKYQGRSTFRTWLYRIVRNQCHTVASRHARHRCCQPWDASLHDHQVVDRDGFAERLERNDSVHLAIKSLSSADRQIIRLRFFSDLSLDAISRRLDLSLSGTKMRLYRALARLRIAYLEIDADATVSA